jgi:Phosphatidylinositol-glycan biosynthesis class S protein
MGRCQDDLSFVFFVFFHCEGKIRASNTGWITPILKETEALHNFTVESQIQFYAPLAFEPLVISNSEEVIHGLTQENLKVFVNSAEWTLGEPQEFAVKSTLALTTTRQRLAYPTTPFSILSYTSLQSLTHHYAYSMTPVSQVVSSEAGVS